MEQPFSDRLRADFENGRLFWVRPPKNHAQRAGGEAGFVNKGKGRNKDYWQIRVFGQTFKRSRLMFYMAHGRWPSPTVDHINGDSLDDRLCNLREATHSQNTANSSRNRALPPCVHLTKQGRYMVRITKDGETLNLGTFDSLKFAAGWADVSHKELFGEYARR